MTIHDPPGLPGEVHLHVPNQMTSDLGPSIGRPDSLLQDLKGNSYILHFFLEGIHPESVAIDAVELFCMSNVSGDLNPILVGPLCEPCLYC